MTATSGNALVEIFAGPSVCRATESFGAWMAEARPEYRWDAYHFREMQHALDRVSNGDLRRVFFSLPIRHGKTEHNSVGYAAYRLERNQQTRVLVCSYNQRQADKISRDIRKLARIRGVTISEDRDTAGEWETNLGGGVRAVGAGAGVASVNADLILIDDPIGSRDEAESQAHRDRVWDWITSDLLARCEPHTAVLFTMSRWHQDDPAGRLLDRFRDRWFILDMPGRAERGDPERATGDPLWPELRGEEWLDEKRVELLEYGFASLIQGRPRPREGGMFKWLWWQLVEEVPRAGSMVRYWDLAGTEAKGRGHDPDYTAGVLLCRMPDLRTAVVDVTRFRKSVAQRDTELESIARDDLTGYRSRISWWIETEAGIAGAERTAHLVRRLQALGLSVRTEHPTGKKVHRAEPLASAAESGNVLLCPGPWRDVFRSEAADFPNGTHDDQIDAAAGAYSKLSTPPPTVAFISYNPY
ncbi:MAG: phage terminase large subunit [Gemmatimonadaceae bacterium]|nr:phage terminase large subunit [Gemmatimonadaceae bacterium]